MHGLSRRACRGCDSCWGSGESVLPSRLSSGNFGSGLSLSLPTAWHQETLPTVLTSMPCQPIYFSPYKQRIYWSINNLIHRVGVSFLIFLLRFSFAGKRKKKPPLMIEDWTCVFFQITMLLTQIFCFGKLRWLEISSSCACTEVIPVYYLHLKI